jgi:hypothetical protein
MVADGPQHRSMYTRDADGPRLSGQPVVEWRSDREHATAAPFSRLQHRDLSSCLTEERCGAQASQAGAYDDDRESR